MEMELLEVQLRDVGFRLSCPPFNVNELLQLIDQTRNVLSKVEQSPPLNISKALRPIIRALVARSLLEYSDLDVKVGVTSCLTEITRITAPEAPYNDDLMKEIFERIIEAFEHLDDVSSCSFSKRVAILQTVARVRSCAVMLDLECDHLILKMFQNFLNTIRPENAEHVFPSMKAIMTLVLEESEDISSELISCLLESVKIDKDNLPIAHLLGEKVISNCAEKLKPYLRELSQSMNLRDYSSVIVSMCQDTTNVSLDISGDIMANDRKQSEQTISDGEEVMKEKLPELGLNNGKTMVNGNSAEEPSTPIYKPVDEDRDSVSDQVPKKESIDANDPEEKPLIHDKKKEPNSVANPAKIPAHAGVNSQKHSNRKEMMSSGNKVHKAKGKREDSANVQSISKRAHVVEETPPPLGIKLDETLVGSRVKVWWPEDVQYYPGTVESYDPYSKQHKIVYDDGDIEVLLMKNERWDLLYSDDENVRDTSLEEPQVKRTKTSSSSASKEKKRSTGSDPPKRKGRPPKALSLAGDQAIQKSGTKKSGAVNFKTDGSISKDDSGSKGTTEVFKSKSNKDNPAVEPKPENYGFL